MITVILQPYNTLSGILGCFCQYYDKKLQQNIAILESGKVAKWKNGEKKPDEVVLYFTINSKDPQKKIVYDEKSQKPQDLHFKMQHDFWVNHPDVKSMNGYENYNTDGTSEPRFLIINLDEKKSGEKADIEMKAKAITKFLGLGELGRKRAAIFYAMPNAVAAEDGDIIIALGDLTKGLLTTKGEFSIGGKKYTYIEHFVNDYQDDSKDTEIVIIVNKAIDKGIITAQLKSGTMLLDCYIFKNVPVATSKDQLIAYMKNNPTELNFISNQVSSNPNKKDTSDDEERQLRKKAEDLKIPNLDKYTLPKLKLQVEAVESGELDRLKQEATDLKIKFHPSIGVETLKEKIKEAKAAEVPA